MASILDSIEEHPEYVFKHLISIQEELTTCLTDECRCVAIDPFTDQIYILMVKNFFGHGIVFIYSESGDFLRSFSHEKMEYTHSMAIHIRTMFI